MSKYLCLRDNFTFSRYHYEGRVYDLADASVVKYPKNFILVANEQNPIPVTTNAIPVVVVEVPSLPEQVTETPRKQYVCSVCGKVVSTALALSGHSRSHKKEKSDGSTNS